MSRNCNRNVEQLHIVELGCGTGLCGIVAAKLGFVSTVTDRCADLGRLNIINAFPEELNCNTPTADIKVFSMPWESSTTKSNADKVITDDDHITAVELEALRGKVDIIVGAEITCLRKQQGLLSETIAQLCGSNSDAIALLSFDGVPPPNDCLYEKDMIQRMAEKGFRHSTVCAASCEWVSQLREFADTEGVITPPTRVSTAYIHDHSGRYVDARNRVSFPTRPVVTTALQQEAVSEPKSTGNQSMEASHLADKKTSCKASSSDIPFIPRIVDDACFSTAEAKSPPSPPQNSEEKGNSNAKPVATRTTKREETTHHIIAFFRPAAVNTCRTCHQQFFRLSGFNSHQACRHHSGLFVCRRHPGETRCSINGLGDGLGYYGNGQDYWKAEFWDCCGSEDPTADGCCTSFHIPY